MRFTVDNLEVFVSDTIGSAAKVEMADDVNTNAVNAAANNVFVKVLMSLCLSFFLLFFDNKTPSLQISCRQNPHIIPVQVTSRPTPEISRRTRCNPGNF